MIKARSILLLLLSIAGNCVSQDFGSKRVKVLAVSEDTIAIDSLSIIKSTIILTDINGNRIDSNCYSIDEIASKLFFTCKTIDSIRISYHTYAINFNKKYNNKNRSSVLTGTKEVKNPFSYVPEKNPAPSVFDLGGLEKNGDISRGISFGNSQDVTINSVFNLQLAGKISDNLNILMSATDNNIPIQPDGSTQQLQEFDKVFIQLYNDDIKLTAGDFNIKNSNTYFLKYFKRAQGFDFYSNAYADTVKKQKMKIGASAAVSRGKFSRNIIQGIENNQGPYRLRGAENEPFIIIISGTEKVYIDGILMDRGQENDYVIDYNTAEVTFTPKQKITKDKRIIIEFQYSDKNYARSIYTFTDEYSINRLKLDLNFYSEQDSKNKPLQQQLNDTQKVVLANSGDSLHWAIIPSADSVAFNGNEVLYLQKDTVVGSKKYSGIYVYSTSDSLAHYRLTFSFVGSGKGNYVPDKSSANGKVYKWVLPDTITGTLKGNYEPVLLLISPKQKQIVNAGATYLFKNDASIRIEGAYSKNDINTFSKKDKKNDDGYALKFQSAFPLYKVLQNNIPVSEITLHCSSEWVGKTFSPVERFRNIEFERDWNRPLNGNSYADQMILGSSISFAHKKKLQLAYGVDYFDEGAIFSGLKHKAITKLKHKSHLLEYSGSYLQTSGNINNSDFLRSSLHAAEEIKKHTLGWNGIFEQNKMYLQQSDSLKQNSFEFLEWEAYTKNADTSMYYYKIRYTQRYDKGVRDNSLHEYAFAKNAGVELKLTPSKNISIRTTTLYRILEIKDSTLTNNKADSSIVGRVEFDWNILKGAISSSTYYEAGSGLELRKIFAYLEVPAGQGVYTWIDYNNNGVKELNEFEIAQFPDQATYIRVLLPTDDYIKTFTNQFSEVITLRPELLWNTKSGLKKFAARFSNQFAYRADKKTSEDNVKSAYNPFIKNPNDSFLLSLNSAVRNTLFFNQTNPYFGVEYTFADNSNKNLLTNGFEHRTQQYNETRVRINLYRQITFFISYKNGIKKNSSEFFSSRNYLITYSEAEPKLMYQPNNVFRITGAYKYSEKFNHKDLGGEKVFINNAGIELRFSKPGKGIVSTKANYILITYNGTSNTAIAYELLESLKAGKNYTWGCSFQQNLSNNMQLMLMYDGRMSEGNKAIHIGSAQVRAYF